MDKIFLMLLIGSHCKVLIVRSSRYASFVSCCTISCVFMSSVSALLERKDFGPSETKMSPDAAVGGCAADLMKRSSSR